MSNSNYKYGRYVCTNQETRWATTDEIKASGVHIDLSCEKYPAAGLPLLSNGKEAYVDNEDTHTLIFGSTGSKKTRLFCMPMLNLFLKAGESFIATDPKGELYAKTSGMAKANGYETVVLNFREIGKGSFWNPLALPYDLYQSGETEAAVSMLNDFVTAIAAPLFANTKDVFWPEMASAFALANLLLLMECAKKEEATIASLARLCSGDCEDSLTFLSENMDPNSIAAMNYKGVLSAAPVTRQSIFASLFGMIRIFNIQKDLTRMLSGSTVNIADFGKKPTAVYIIIPDEKTTYHVFVTMFVKQVYEILISEAQKMPQKRLPVRVNFVLDEFCNLPRVPDMPSMISASRSRNMRFFLVVQSLHQLRGKYGEDADTIKGNCDNWVFLTSKELALLNEISELCGSVYTSDGRQRRLISPSELQRLDKMRGESLIMHARQYPIITEIADIDMYEAFKGYEPVSLDNGELPEAKLFDVNKLCDNIKENGLEIPFSNGKKYDSSSESSGFSWDDFFKTDSDDSSSNDSDTENSDSDSDETPSDVFDILDDLLADNNDNCDEDSDGDTQG